MRKEPPPLRETIASSVQTLKTQRNKIYLASHRLRERDKTLFRACISALNDKKGEKASICANEIAEVRKLLKFLHNVELAIERVLLRLETVKELSEIVTDLKPSLRLLQRVSQELFSVLPDVSSELTQVNETISETLYATRISADPAIIPVDRKTAGGEEILKEVSGFLERKLAEELPEPPTTVTSTEAKQATLKEMVALTATCSQSIGRETEESETDSSQTLISYKKAEIQEISLKVEKPSLEEILLDYVRKSNGEIDMTRCSDELKTPHQEVQKALQNLGAKGKIRIELKTTD